MKVSRFLNMIHHHYRIIFKNWETFIWFIQYDSGSYHVFFFEMSNRTAPHLTKQHCPKNKPMRRIDFDLELILRNADSVISKVSFAWLVNFSRNVVLCGAGYLQGRITGSNYWNVEGHRTAFSTHDPTCSWQKKKNNLNFPPNAFFLQKTTAMNCSYMLTP